MSSEEKDRLEEVLVHHGLTTHVPLTGLNIGIAVSDLPVAEVLVTRALPMDALLKGMNSLGLGELLHKYPCVVGKVFSAIHHASIDAELIRQKLHLADSETKDTEAKEKAWQWFQKFVLESESTKGKYITI